MVRSQGYLKGEASIQAKHPEVSVSEDIRHQLRTTLTGLTQYEITNILGIAAVAERGFTAETVKQVQRLKARTFEREEALTWIDPDTIMEMDNFSGFENYLEWISETRESYTDEAAAAGIKPDKGVLLLGIPGTGKSMIAMATAKEMGLPLIKMDFSSLMGSLVGQSEENMRRVLRRISAEGPCVVLLDESDKAFANVTGPQAGSNVDAHLFGQLISWMANDNKYAFIIMTMNRLKGVPIELVRSGRISAIYFTTFPTAVEREEILRLKLIDNNCSPDVYTEDQYRELVKKTDQYVGAELEEVVRKAVKMAWKRRKTVQPTVAELWTATSRVRPVAALDYENKYLKALELYRSKEANPATSVPPLAWQPDNVYRDPFRYAPYASR
jgi:SpoVK/Ycf46/Vps4 family AAA+-type ATPase